MTDHADFYTWYNDFRADNSGNDDDLWWLKQAWQAARDQAIEDCAKLADDLDAFYDAPCPGGDPTCIHQDTPFSRALRGLSTPSEATDG